MLPAPRCPRWCQRPVGHDLDDPAALGRDGSLSVRHVALVGDVRGRTLKIEQVAVIGGQNPGVGPAVLVVGGAREYTAAEARELAAAYSRAAAITGVA